MREALLIAACQAGDAPDTASTPSDPAADQVSPRGVTNQADGEFTRMRSSPGCASR